MSISLSEPVGVSSEIVVGNASDQQNILDAMHVIRFIAAPTSHRYMNGGSARQNVQRWKTLIGQFQIQFMRGTRGVFDSERSSRLDFSSPDCRIDPRGDTLRILNKMLDARLLVSVSLDRQRAYVIRAGRLRRDYQITSGSVGNNTPVGLFNMRWRNTVNTSGEARDYTNGDGDPMPYSVFFTEGGHALHAGRIIPISRRHGSHGCIRQDRGGNLARTLWEEVESLVPNSSRNVRGSDGRDVRGGFVFVFDRQGGGRGNPRRGDIPGTYFRF